MKYFIGYFIISYLYIFNIVAQDISGFITDAKSQEPLPGANAYIPELHKGAVTDANGYFELKNIPNGSFNIQFSYIGYKTEVRKIMVRDENVQLNITLSPTVVEAQEIVVSAPYMSVQEENPVQVVQMKEAELMQSSGTTLLDKLATLPGINQVSTGVSIGKPVIRGLSFNRVLVYSQGVRLENQQWGDEHGLGLSDLGIEKVEIIKGPSSMLYGSDAMGGVIHLIDERPAKPGTAEGEYKLKLFSNTLGYETSAGAKGAGEKWRYGLYAGYASHADYKTGDDYRVQNSRFTEKGLKANIGYSSGKWISLLNYNLLDGNIGLPEGTGNSLSREIMEPYQHLTTHLVSNQNTFFTGNSKIKLNLGYISNIRSEYGHGHEDDHDTSAHEEDEDPALKMSLNTFSWDGKYYFPTSKRTEIIAGVQGMYQTNTNAGEEILIPDATIIDAGALALLKLNLSKLTLLTGIRYDLRNIETEQHGEEGEEHFRKKLSRSFTSINASLGGTFQAREELLFRVNIASGFRAPNLAELTSDGVHEGTNRFEIGNTELKREQNIEADLGINYDAIHISFDLAAYYNYIFDYVYLNPTGEVEDGTPVFEYIQNDAVLKGFEAVVDIHPHPLDWLHFETTLAYVNGNTSDGTDLPLIPAVTLVNQLRGEFGEWKKFSNYYIKAEVINVLSQNNVAPYESPTNGYFLINAGAGTYIYLGNQKALLALNINNMLDRRFVSHLSRLKDEGIYNMGRNITLNISIPFGIKK